MDIRHLFQGKETSVDAILINAFDAYADALFRFCFIRTRNREQAKDTTQEAFVRTWEYLREGKEIANIRAFLYKVARNLIIDESRKKRSASLEDLAEKGIEPMQDERAQIETHIDFKSVMRHLDRLGEIYKEVLTLRFVDGFSPKEIAALLEENENVVYVRIHRGLKELRNIVHE